MEQCRAILVRRHRWSESSLIVTWLTDRHGTLRTSARGALKRGGAFYGRLDLFARAEIGLVFSRRSSLHALREVQIERAFQSTGYAALALASYFGELAAAVAPEMQPAHDLHDLLARALDHLASNPPSLRAFQHFESETARILGVGDTSGKIRSDHALAALCGRLPRSRLHALEAVGVTGPTGE
jgi:DNA repair protein RecO (recombination protein O)